MFKRIFGSARKKPVKEFTVDQLKLMQRLLNKEIDELNKKKQGRIDELSKKGETISTETILESLDELKTSYDGNNPKEYFFAIDKMKQDFHERYGDSIPVDLAYKISEGIELPFGEEFPFVTEGELGENAKISLEKYYNQSDCYSISLPTSWERKEGYLESSVIALEPLKGKGDALRGNVNVSVNRFEKSVSLNDWLVGYINSAQQESQLKNVITHKQGDYFLNGQTSKFVIFSYSLNKQRIKAIVFLTNNKEMYYEITCTAAPDTFLQYNTIFEKIVNTFEVEDEVVKEESAKESAIELAKKCVINTDPEHGDITWEDIMDNINNRILNGQLENYKFTGWEAIEVSESEYTVVCKNEHDGEMSGEVFFVDFNENTVRHIGLGKGKDADKRIEALTRYVMLVLTSSTFSFEIASQRARDVLSALMKEEYVKQLEDMGVLKDLRGGK